MRDPVDAPRLARVLDAFGRVADAPLRVYLVGGATAVAEGWRAATVDVDFVMRPESAALLRAVPALKERLGVNVELASPLDFIPVPPGWEDRSPFVRQAGAAAVHHFDLYAQALAKVERGHGRDLGDVRAMVARGLIAPAAAWRYFARIEPELYRFPAIDPPAFRAAVARAFGGPPPADVSPA